jgi:hypothetical protein
MRAKLRFEGGGWSGIRPEIQQSLIPPATQPCNRVAPSRCAPKASLWERGQNRTSRRGENAERPNGTASIEGRYRKQASHRSLEVLQSSMASIPKKVAERLVAGIKRFQPVLTAAKGRDVGEADTVTIIKDMLADVFGYDKYSEVTSEFAIRGTYCDLATKLDGTLQALIEVKAIGLELKDHHVKQVVDYAANQAVDWVILTNGVCWRVYHIVFAKPIDQELVIDIDFCALNPRSDADLDLLYLWCKEGWVRSVLGEYHTQKQALSRFFLGAMILTDPVLDVVRRELRRVSPEVRIETEQIRAVLMNEVIKREVMEGDKADEARKKITRSQNKVLRAKETKTEAASGPSFIAPLDTTVSPEILAKIDKE